MVSASTTTEQSNSLCQIITLMEKRLIEIQALDYQMHSALTVNEIPAAITSPEIPCDQIFV